MEVQFVYLNNDGQQEGPMPLELVLALQDAGDLSCDTKVMEEGSGRWTTLGEAQQQEQQQQQRQQQQLAPKPQTVHPSWSEQWRPAQAADNRTFEATSSAASALKV